jgi:hypothetical protein
MKQVVGFIHTGYYDWLHSYNNLRPHSPGVKLSKTRWLLARHWRVPANQTHAWTRTWIGRAVSQRRLTIYWETNERLGRSRAVSGATRFEVWWMRANRAPTAMCHRQRFLALEMFEPAPLVQQLREQNWRTKMLGSAENGVAPPTRNPNQPWALDSHQCRLSGQSVGTRVGWQKIKQRLQVPELRRRRCKIVDSTGRMRHSTHEHGASEGYRTPAVHSRSVRDS